MIYIRVKVFLTMQPYYKQGCSLWECKWTPNLHGKAADLLPVLVVGKAVIYVGCSLDEDEGLAFWREQEKSF